MQANKKYLKNIYFEMELKIMSVLIIPIAKNTTNISQIYHKYTTNIPQKYYKM